MIKLFNLDKVTKVILHNKEKKESFLKFKKGDWKFRPIKPFYKGKKWDENYYSFNHIYTSSEKEILKNKYLIIDNGEVYIKPYIEIYTVDKTMEEMFFSSDKEMNEVVNNVFKGFKKIIEK